MLGWYSIMLNEIGQVVRDTYHRMFPSTRIQSIHQESRQNIIKNTETENSLTVTRGEYRSEKKGGLSGMTTRNTWTKQTCDWKQEKEVVLASARIMMREK